MRETNHSKLYEAAKTPYTKEWQLDAAALLNDKFLSYLKPGEQIRLEAMHGDELVLLRALVGTNLRAQVFELCIEDGRTEAIDDSFALLLDYLDGVLEEFFLADREARLPLDFTRRVFDQVTLFARQETRNFEAELLAESFLSNSRAKRDVN